MQIQLELLLERDTHGNVQICAMLCACVQCTAASFLQGVCSNRILPIHTFPNMCGTPPHVARIETEKLLIKLVDAELATRRARGEYSGKFAGLSHYFGYEGRCSLPSDFDATYADALAFYWYFLCVWQLLFGGDSFQDVPILTCVMALSAAASASACTCLKEDSKHCFSHHTLLPIMSLTFFPHKFPPIVAHNFPPIVANRHLPRYCNALGHGAAALVEHNATGVMVGITNFAAGVTQWNVNATPLVNMMVIERRKGKYVPRLYLQSGVPVP